MIGGLQEIDVTAEHQEIVKVHLAAINSKGHTHHTSFHVDKAWSQVVAGTNYFFHLTSNDHHKYSVFIHLPLPHTNQPPQVLLFEK